MIASATATCAVDVAVLGAGPAGIGAAIAAHAAGRSVLLIDEAPTAGGQIYRKVPDALLPVGNSAADTDPDRRAGDASRRELSGSGVRTAFGWRVWSVMRSERGFRLDAISDGGAHAMEAPALLIATGAGRARAAVSRMDDAGRVRSPCQPARKSDPRSACNSDPPGEVGRTCPRFVHGPCPSLTSGAVGKGWISPWAQATPPPIGTESLTVPQAG